MYLESFIDFLQNEKRYSPHTLKAYKTDIEEFEKLCLQKLNIDIQNVNKKQIRNWLVELVEKKKLKHIHKQETIECKIVL
jgi:integrase/recombinase XerC